jgi:hypothetical protein
VGLATPPALLSPVGGHGARLLQCLELPKGAAQGPREWYRISLDLSATVLAPTGGSVVVSVLTAGAAAAQVHFLNTPDGLVATGSSVRGIQEAGPVSGDSIQLKFENYWQRQGVRDGPVPVEVIVEQYGDARLQRLELLNGSYVEWTTEPPYPLTVAVNVPSDIDIGDSYDALYVASWRKTDRAEPDVAVTVQSVETSPGLVVERVRSPKIETRNSASGAIRLKPTKLGPHEVTLTLTMGEERAATVATTVAGPRSETTWLRQYAVELWFVAGALFFLLPTMLRVRRRRSVLRR